MENLKNLLSGWRGLFVVFIAVLIGTTALFMQSCKAKKEMSNKTFVRTETILEIVNDTVVKVQPDSASIKALLECDSVGNVLLKRIAEYEAGKHVNPPKLDIQDNVLTAMVKVDSFGIFMTFRERYVERTDFMESQEREIVYVNRLTGWQKFRVRLGDFVLIGVPIYVVFKCRKSIWSWIRKILFRK